MQTDLDMEKSKTMDSSYSGSTACMALVHNGYVYMANVGDSGACLGRLGSNGRTQAVELTTYARPNDPRVRHPSSGRDMPALTAGSSYRIPSWTWQEACMSPGSACQNTLTGEMGQVAG